MRQSIFPFFKYRLFPLISSARSSNGVSMTISSGAPYVVPQHGHPRVPNMPQPQVPSYNNGYHNAGFNNGPQRAPAPGHQMTSAPGHQMASAPGHQGEYTNNGFVSTPLSVPTSSIGHSMQPQPIRPIQPGQVRHLSAMGTLHWLWSGFVLPGSKAIVFACFIALPLGIIDIPFSTNHT